MFEKKIYLYYDQRVYIVILRCYIKKENKPSKTVSFKKYLKAHVFI